MKLTLSKSIIRSFRRTDVDSLVTHAGSYSVARNLAVLPHPYTREHGEQWIAIATGRTPESNFAITIDDEVVGGIGISIGDAERPGICDHCGEIGYWLGEPFWGRGIVTEAVVALTEWAFTELGLVRLFAPVFARNTASARVLEKSRLRIRRPPARTLLPRRRIHRRLALREGAPATLSRIEDCTRDGAQGVLTGRGHSCPRCGLESPPSVSAPRFHP